MITKALQVNQALTHLNLKVTILGVTQFSATDIDFSRVIASQQRVLEILEMH